MEYLHRIRHTEVLTEVFSGELKALAPQKEERVCQVSSERLDAVIAKTYNLSREKSLLLFREKKIFVNGKIQENNSAAPKLGDIVSVRGYGKFCYLGMESMTRKGKYSVRVAVYV